MSSHFQFALNYFNLFYSIKGWKSIPLKKKYISNFKKRVKRNEEFSETRNPQSSLIIPMAVGSPFFPPISNLFYALCITNALHSNTYAEPSSLEYIEVQLWSLERRDSLISTKRISVLWQTQTFPSLEMLKEAREHWRKRGSHQKSASSKIERSEHHKNGDPKRQRGIPVESEFIGKYFRNNSVMQLLHI